MHRWSNVCRSECSIQKTDNRPFNLLAMAPFLIWSYFLLQMKSLDIFSFCSEVVLSSRKAGSHNLNPALLPLFIQWKGGVSTTDWLFIFIIYLYITHLSITHCLILTITVFTIPQHLPTWIILTLTCALHKHMCGHIADHVAKRYGLPNWKLQWIPQIHFNKKKQKIYIHVFRN